MVEFAPELACELSAAARSRTTPYRKVTVSDLVREAVAVFLLPRDENVFHRRVKKITKETAGKGSGT